MREKTSPKTRFGAQPPDRGRPLIVPEVGEFEGIMAFSTRRGGCSPAPFDSLNFSARDGDGRENVGRNLALLGERLGIDPSEISFCKQVHEDAVEVVESVPHEPPMADAMITAVPGVFPAVKTADCLPILLLDPVNRVTAAVHAGWKGTLLRITRKVLGIMKGEFHTDPSELTAALGPAIGPCCYEVDEKVLAPFRERFPSAESFIFSLTHLNQMDRSPSGRVQLPGSPAGAAAPIEPTRPPRESFRIDLVEANRLELLAEGIPERNIRAVNLCTACYPDLFFSHRRDNGLTGRHVALAGFRR